MDLEAQDDELLVLTSIFEEYFRESQSSDSKGGELVIHLDLPHSIILTTDNGSSEQHKVHHLPPLYLYFHYPANYPSSAQPNYTLCCEWISRPKLGLICKELDRLWDENKGDVILYTWSQYIKEETLGLLNISDSLNVDEMRPKRVEKASAVTGQEPAVSGSAVTAIRSISKSSCEKSESCDMVNSSNNVTSIRCNEQLAGAESSAAAGAGVASPSKSHQQSSNSSCDDRTLQGVTPKTNLMLLLLEFDKEKRRKEFETKYFECKVCFCQRIGTQCMEFWPCGHVYCKECMKGYFLVKIKDGDVAFMRCPDDKCTSEANPKQVQALVPQELYERYDALLLTRAISSMGDSQPCPRKHCQYPVTIDNNQGFCPSCSFVFCAICRFGEHGVEPCKLKNSAVQKVMDQYMNGDSEVKKALETRYGRQYLRKLCDELLSMNYITSNAKKCPKCSAQIEKTDGCNKMVCQQCATFFCWLCMTRLNPDRPYDHFNGPKSNCFNRLFEGVDMEDEDMYFDDYDDDEDDYDLYL